VSKDLPILVVGAGLGGVAAALGLARQGRRVRIIEAAPELGVIGYGIQLGPNVFPMFRRLGVEREVLAHAHFPPDVLMLDAITGEDVIRVRTGEAFRARFRDPYVAIHRVDLHGVLLDACRAQPGIEIMTSSECVSVEQTDTQVTVRLADGRQVEGCALIGADGLGSAVRRQFIGEEKPRPIGYVAHRTIVPMDEVPAHVRRDEVILWGGPGFHIVQYPLRDRTLFNIVAVFRTENLYERADEEAYRQVLMRTYASAHPTMHDMLRMMDLKRRWVIADRDPIRTWSFGRVTLLGDSAHPTLQSYAQGACMAIEDAIVIAERIRLCGEDYAGAFRLYEKVRVLRTARVVLESRHLWEFYHLGGIEAEVRNEASRGQTDDDIYRCLAWIYDGPNLPE
jgi:2-polyprenyl-6-methoxyphenol hydroxylase-like FAD-dependent oxidoreductase